MGLRKKVDFFLVDFAVYIFKILEYSLPSDSSWSKDLRLGYPVRNVSRGDVAKMNVALRPKCDPSAISQIRRKQVAMRHRTATHLRPKCDIAFQQLI